MCRMCNDRLMALVRSPARCRVQWRCECGEHRIEKSADPRPPGSGFWGWLANVDAPAVVVLAAVIGFTVASVAASLCGK